MTHRNAPMTPEGRARMVALVLDHGWPQRRVAERLQVSPATVCRWVRRARDRQGLEDRSSRPHRCSRQLCQRQERRIIALRFTHQWGPHRISARLGIPRSTVGRVLHRYRMPKLAWIDQATGLPVRRPAVNRYEASAPGGNWSMSTSRSWAGSLTAEDGGPTAAAQPRTWSLTEPRTQQPEPGRQLLVATGSYITRSMTTPG